MGILIDHNSRVLFQGITGKEGSFHAERCIEYGTNVVGGVVPGRGGESFMGTVPVFDSVLEAKTKTEANVSIIFVPPAFAADAIFEAIDAQIGLIVCITEGIPIQDATSIVRYLEGKPTRLLGPNCPGLITPSSHCKVGIMPGPIHKPGAIGVISRSGTLTYEAVNQLTDLGIGQSTCVGIGGDPVSGLSFIDILELFNEDPATEAIVLIGEIGGQKEQEAARFIKNNVKKPVAALIVGQTAPKGRRMGHAGAVITGTAELASEKIQQLRDAGCHIIPNPGEIGVTVQRMLHG